MANCVDGFGKSESKQQNDLATITFNAPYPVPSYGMMKDHAIKVVWLVLYLKNEIFSPFSKWLEACV